MRVDPLFPLRFLLVLFAGLVNREQEKVVDSLREERFLRPIKDECTPKRLFLGEPVPRRAISEFLLQYHRRERNHQAKGIFNPWPAWRAFHSTTSQ